MDKNRVVLSVNKMGERKIVLIAITHVVTKLILLFAPTLKLFSS